MKPFELIPAIDLLGGQCVRLSQGRYDDATVYDGDPGRVAGGFRTAGVRRIHVVDLDGAKAGSPANREAIAKVIEAAGDVPVQLGGGLRDMAGIEAALETGIDRAILGTVALRDPALVKEAACKHAERIVVGIDARDGLVAVEGWLEASEVTAVEVARRFEDVGVAAIVYTDIARDGMLSGPNLESTAELADALTIPVIVSGGVSSETDIVRSAALARHGIAGVIVGRAIYTGDVSLPSALARLAGGDVDGEV